MQYVAIFYKNCLFEILRVFTVMCLELDMFTNSNYSALHLHLNTHAILKVLYAKLVEFVSTFIFPSNLIHNSLRDISWV